MSNRMSTPYMIQNHSCYLGGAPMVQKDRESMTLSMQYVGMSREPQALLHRNSIPNPLTERWQYCSRASADKARRFGP